MPLGRTAIASCYDYLQRYRATTNRSGGRSATAKWQTSSTAQGKIAAMATKIETPHRLWWWHQMILISGLINFNNGSLLNVEMSTVTFYTVLSEVLFVLLPVSWTFWGIWSFYLSPCWLITPWWIISFSTMIHIFNFHILNVPLDTFFQAQVC